MMVEVIGEMYSFNWIYDPPADGEWGAFQESGMMSGLIGQAGCKKLIFKLYLTCIISLRYSGLGHVWRDGNQGQVARGRQSCFI